MYTTCGTPLIDVHHLWYTFNRCTPPEGQHYCSHPVVLSLQGSTPLRPFPYVALFGESVLSPYLSMAGIILLFSSSWKMTISALASVAQVVGASFSKTKGHGFCSMSGHMPRLRFWSLVGARTRGNQLMFLSSINVALLLSLPPFPSLTINKYVLEWG